MFQTEAPSSMLKPCLLCFILALLFLNGFPAFAQQEIRVAGTVLRPDKKSPIPAASISVLHKAKGAIADMDGKFLISISAGDTLVAQAIGYRPEKYTPKQGDDFLNLNMVLEEDTLTLGEVEILSKPLPSMMLRPVPSFTKNPSFIPAPAPAPALKPLGGSPISALYNRFSKEGKDRRHLIELKQQTAKAEEEAERQQYNSFFKDNTGYEQ